ncbi:MAG TPA: NADPH:quinone oxidoreductase family protein [Candidatus Baltobacteraceae bacterium]|nr:NADPH:quinone oxidoreductase family protein [Candidatus Baltobacteraceae bacterium]
MMRAIVVRELGDPCNLGVSDVDVPSPGAGEVALAVHAAGVNFPDALMLLGKYQVKPPLPFVLGIEAAGVVTAVGEGVDDLRPGDRVAAPAKSGAFAEQVVVRASAAIRLPDDVDFVTAAGMVLTYGTAYHALVDRARLRSGDRLVVTGAGGGVGTAACDIGRALGADVTALVGSVAKSAAAAAAGAARVVIADVELTARLKAEIGAVDVLLDNVGGDVFDAALRAMEWNGRVLVVGFAGGRIPEIAANRLLLKELDAIGVYWGTWLEREPARNRANFGAMFELMAQGSLRPRVHATYPLERAPEAVTAMLERRLVGKAVIAVRG